MNIEHQPEREQHKVGRTNSMLLWSVAFPAHCVTEERVCETRSSTEPVCGFCCLSLPRPRPSLPQPPSLPPSRVCSTSPLLLTGHRALILRAINSTRARNVSSNLFHSNESGGNGGGGGSGGGGGGGRSETRHLKLAPTKTTVTAAAAGRSRG